MKYNHKTIERKWQKKWEGSKLYEVKEKSAAKKLYVLDMFPYPSAQGLHVGHPEGYTASDIVTRYKMMRGYNVLHPMGWDAFGLPAENYAIKTGVHPAIAAEKNIKNFRRQIKSLGFAYDWSREVNTTDPEYYKWTQWIFLQLFKAGLAYEAVVPINFCPSCKTGIANEEVIGGLCERCKTKVVKKDIRQWMLKITVYAERLLNDLKLLDWPERIKEMQKNWIGRSEGALIQFSIINYQSFPRRSVEGIPQSGTINVFTTRPDTLFGATYLVLAPEHLAISNLKSQISNLKEVEKYVCDARQKTDLERTDLAKTKTGVELRGVLAKNPATGKNIPIWVADYVLPHYGTGAIMAVPGHDSRDFEFAKKNNLPIAEVIMSEKRKFVPGEDGGMEPETLISQAYEGEGVLINSGKFNGLDSREARAVITKFVSGKKEINYKLRDWVFSRQRYWGEPIPLVHCPKCGVVAIPEKDLPLKLPKLEKFQPTGTGESPLALVKDWVNTKCPKCGGPAVRETNTMPQWAGSCWYYAAYCVRGISNFQFRPLRGIPRSGTISKKELNYWLPVDLYIGGAEHAVLHLLYARFWHKFLYDKGFVNTLEPFMKLKNQGLILGEDGQKMSKSRGNVVNPDDIIKKFGADTMRMYEMFIGPFEDTKPWSTRGMVGIKRFLERVWNIFESSKLKVQSSKLQLKIQNNKNTESDEINRLLHKTIKKVTEDIENFKFNTAISAMMVLVNQLTNNPDTTAEILESFLKILSPFAPHLAEELWANLGHKKSIFLEKWPEYDKKLVAEANFVLVIQINGKMRDSIEADVNIDKVRAEKLVLERDKVKKYIVGKKIIKVIYVPGRIINFVVR